MSCGALLQVQALGAYNGILRQAVRYLKFYGRRDLARFLGTALAREALLLEARLNTMSISDEVLVWVPVPCYPKKRNERGYDHTLLLAKAAACSHGVQLAINTLERVRDTPPLYRLSRRERATVLAGAFAVRDIPPRRALLVDDILTTGATALECTKVLRAAGAKEVALLVVARA